MNLTPEKQWEKKNTMDSENILEVINKLVGEIQPVGEAHTDERRFENLKKMVYITDMLIGSIDRVIPNKRRVEASMKKAGEYASKFFDDLGITE